jgi:hypothetical protein
MRLGGVGADVCGRFGGIGERVGGTYPVSRACCACRGARSAAILHTSLLCRRTRSTIGVSRQLCGGAGRVLVSYLLLVADCILFAH